MVPGGRGPEAPEDDSPSGAGSHDTHGLVAWPWRNHWHAGTRQRPCGCAAAAVAFRAPPKESQRRWVKSGGSARTFLAQELHVTLRARRGVRLSSGRGLSAAWGGAHSNKRRHAACGRPGTRAATGQEQTPDLGKVKHHNNAELKALCRKLDATQRGTMVTRRMASQTVKFQEAAAKAREELRVCVRDGRSKGSAGRIARVPFPESVNVFCCHVLSPLSSHASRVFVVVCCTGAFGRGL